MNETNAETPSIAPEVWAEIPEITVDVEQVHRRGHLLRRRRRMAAAGVSIGAVAMVGGIAWAVLNGLAPNPQEPATGIGDPEPTTSSHVESTVEPTTPDVDPSSGDGGSGEGHTSEAETQVPRLQAEDLEVLAEASGLVVDRLTVEGNMLDAGLVHATGAYVSVTVTAADATSVAEVIEQAVADRPYMVVTIDGNEVHYREPGSPGAPAHWVLASPDGTQMISVDAVPPGGEAAGNMLPDSVITTVERDLIPALADG